MRTIELKEKIKHQIDFVDDRMLRIINALLETDRELDVYQFSDNELQLLHEAENDIDNNQLLSNEEVEIEVLEWLKSRK